MTWKRQKHYFNAFFSSVFICEEVANIPRVVRQSRTTELLTAMDIDDSRVGLLDLLEKLQSDKSPGPDLYRVSPSQSAILPLLGWPLVSVYTMAYCVHGRPTEWDKKPVWYTVSFTAEMRDDFNRIMTVVVKKI